MALIPPSFIDCVVALGKTKPDGPVHWGASGFFYGKFFEEGPEPDMSVYKVYLVTNRHVLAGSDQVSIRVNPQGAGQARDFIASLSDPSTEEKLWYGHDDDQVDVAVLPINFQLLLDEGMEVSMFTSDATSLEVSAMKESQVSEGDFVYALGFPLGLVGEERNTVIVRSGTIARVRETFDNPRYRFLVDAVIFPGNSGGPIVTKPELIAIKGTGAKTDARLIGIVSGYVPYQDMAVSSQTNRIRVIFEENSGLTTVYSVDCINEAIDALVKSVSGDSPQEAEPQPVDEPSLVREEKG
jgi:S1-C subfamily serine protease